MKILRSHKIDCWSGNCPTVHVTDDGRVLVQGYRLSDNERFLLKLPENEDVISMDEGVLRELAKKLNA